MKELIRIEAKHFVAGIVIRDKTVIEAAPIVAYMKKWPAMRAKDYCERRGWRARRVTA